MNHETPDQVHGRLLEGVHVTGYAFERACSNLEWLLAEDRWRLNGKFENINDFLAGVRLDHFRVVAEQRRRIAKRIKELQPTAGNTTIAGVLGVSDETIRRDTSSTNVEVTNEKSNRNNDEVSATSTNVELSGAEAATLALRRAERRERDQEAEQRRADAALLVPANANCTVDIRHGDFRGVLADLRDANAIITDPPYGQEFLPLLRELAVFAHQALKPDGILAVLFGQTYLPEAYALMSGFRPYRWTACYLTEGNGYVSHARKVQSNWKPVLIYGGGERRFSDLVKSENDAAGKERHVWGQNFDAFKDLIERLTDPGATVVDPFLGGGTTLLAAKAAGRHGIGCDIDEQAVSNARTLLG